MDDFEQMKTAVVIANMGGPDSLDCVEDYLTNVFRDPAIIDIPLPGPLRERFARWLAKKRTPKTVRIFEHIGGKTPLTEITRRQAELLENNLNTAGLGAFRVFPAMRYWHPLLEDVWRDIAGDGFERLIVVSLFPYYSYAMSGSLFDLVKRLNGNGDFTNDNLVLVERFGSHPAFVEAMAADINAALAGLENPDGETTHLILSAHSVPLRSIKKGDPYKDEIEASVNAVKRLLPENVSVHLTYQSKIGPVKWLGPFTTDKIAELAGRGVKRLCVYPLGHVADNSETLYELGMLLRDLAVESGIDSYNRIDALNAGALFIDALTRIVLEEIEHH